LVGGGISIFDESSSRLSFFTPRPRIRNQFMCVWGGVRRAKLIMLALALSLSWRPRRTSNVSPPITITKAAANLIIIETHARTHKHMCARLSVSPMHGSYSGSQYWERVQHFISPVVCTSCCASCLRLRKNS
jgi:hypothetical protein